MAYFFTSDLHFGSRITLKRENRPFKNVDDFNEYVVKVWNSQANKTDFIYVLGDFFSYSYVDRISYKSAINLVKKINILFLTFIISLTLILMSDYLKKISNMDNELKFLIVLIRISDKLSKLIFKSEYMNIDEGMINIVMDKVINNSNEFIYNDKLNKIIFSIKNRFIYKYCDVN